MNSANSLTDGSRNHSEGEVAATSLNQGVVGDGNFVNLLAVDGGSVGAL